MRVIVFVVLAGMGLALTLTPIPSYGVGGKSKKLKAKTKAVQDTLKKSTFLQKVRGQSNSQPYYGKVRMVAGASDEKNTFTFWVYGKEPPYRAYTIDFDKKSATAMMNTVVLAVQKDATVAVYSDADERPNWIVVYP